MSVNDIQEYIISHLDLDSELDFDEDVFDEIIKNNIEK